MSHYKVMEGGWVTHLIALDPGEGGQSWKRSSPPNMELKYLHQVSLEFTPLLEAQNNQNNV
jgi:hypothetical protein